jgi:carbon starvation protein CstA
MYLYLKKKNMWIAVVPATFMSAVSMTYILQAPEGFKLPIMVSYPSGVAFALAVLAFFLFVTRKKARV